ncbi:unnamed protein product [Bemisia tabaci]|uniref:DNA-3-methyladenine glycosylase n=1 Tax=Bemisia tabaci TaxID=7038 RepID=A0A9P0A7Q8_BEMTA|nr:unnamed protein product [Bemisia tabaci]
MQFFCFKMCDKSVVNATSKYFTDNLEKNPHKRFVSGERVKAPFYNQPCEELAKCLLGKILVRQLSNGSVLRGMIVETESYLGGEDLASHSCGGRETPANKPMFMSPGTAYVYFTYGMYHCFNISSKGEGAAVLLRAVQPIEGIEEMQRKRKQFMENMYAKRRAKRGLENNIKASLYQDKKITELCNGPSKLCISFDIDIASCNKCDLVKSDSLWIEYGADGTASEPMKIVEAPRIGIDSAGPIWANKLLRFYIFGSEFVSRQNKACEENLPS